MRITENLIDRGGSMLDRLLYAADRTTARLRGIDNNSSPASAPTQCVGAISHWRVEGREGYLVATARALLTQAPWTSCAVMTNDASGVASVLESNGLPATAFATDAGLVDFLLGAPGRIACVQWQDLERQHPFRLTWAHKDLFRSIVRDHDAFADGLSHLVYIEDDLELAPDALEYWCAMRAALAPRGLIPGFTRSEGPDDDLRLTSPVRPHQITELAGFDWPPDTDGVERRIVNMHFPYQGFYVLDAPLASFHFSSSSFRGVQRSKLSGTLGGTWGVRERAAAGAMFDRVPVGYRSRNMLLLERSDASHFQPVAPALVRHLPGNYFADPKSQKATVHLRRAFVG